MDIKPYEEDVALCGPETPKVEKVEDLIRLLVTVRHRFGNTCIHWGSLSWGGSALWAMSDTEKTIEQLQSEVERLREERDKLERLWKICDKHKGSKAAWSTIERPVCQGCLLEERDEAREAARWLWENGKVNTMTDRGMELWPWLEDE